MNPRRVRCSNPLVYLEIKPAGQLPWRMLPPCLSFVRW